MGERDARPGRKEREVATEIHPTAIVHPDAILEDEVAVGPFCVIGPDVFLGARTDVRCHVTIEGRVRVGCENTIFPNVVIGLEPQDLGYRDTPGSVEIGDRNIIREGVTIHRATAKEDGVTRVGSDNFLMADCHVAHDAKVGSHVTIANQTLLGGHVHIHDHAALSGMIAIHHFTTIGSYAFVGGMSRIVTDVPPYMLVEGNPAVIRCVNLVGLKRNGFSPEECRSLSAANRLLFRTKMNHVRAWEALEGQDQLTEPVRKLFDFLAEQRQGRFGRGRERLRAA